MGEFEYVLFLRNIDNKVGVNDLSTNLNITSINDIRTLETPGFTDANVKYSSSTSGRVTYNTNALPDKDLTVVNNTNNPSINGDMLFYNLKGHGLYDACVLTQRDRPWNHTAEQGHHFCGGQIRLNETDIPV